MEAVLQQFNAMAARECSYQRLCPLKNRFELLRCIVPEMHFHQSGNHVNSINIISLILSASNSWALP